MRSETDLAPALSEPGAERVSHAWTGVVGPRPTVLTAVSGLAILAIFAHLLIDLPTWWPYAAGSVAVGLNLVLAYWQAGSHRVVAVTDGGIQVLRKARWSPRCTEVVGTMPRMPLGPLAGRWCRASIANSMLWIHRSQHPIVADFDAEHRRRYRTLAGPSSAASGTIHHDQR